MFIAVRILNTFTEHMRELLRIYFLFSIFFLHKFWKYFHDPL